VTALWESFVAVTWVAVLGILLLYMFGCLATSLFGNNTDMQQELPEETQHYWGSVERSMLTLLQIMTLDSWCSSVTRTFLDKFPYTCILTVVFMTIGGLGLMNLLAAVYVDKLIQITSQKQAKEEYQKMLEKQNMAQKLGSLFAKFDDDANGVLTENELLTGMKALDTNGNGAVDNQELAENFAAAGLSIEDAQQVIAFLMNEADIEEDAETEVDYRTFVDCIFSLHNTCERKDALEILSCVKNVQAQLTKQGRKVASLEQMMLAQQQMIQEIHSTVCKPQS